jgi:hypothetical protein
VVVVGVVLAAFTIRFDDRHHLAMSDRANEAAV